LEEEIASAHDTLAARYPGYFHGLETDWNAVTAALDWTAKFNPIRLGMGLDKACLEAAIDPQRVHGVRNSYQKLSHLVNSIQEQLEFLSTVFDKGSVAPGGAVEQMPIENLVSWINLRVQKIGELSDWVQFQSLRRDAEAAGLSGFVAEAVDRLIEPEQLEAALERRLLVTQLDEIYHLRPRLRRFQWRDQDDLVRQFRLLDQRLMSTFSRLVQARVKQNQPNRNAAAGGQLGFLRRELTKQRRHAPLRRLFEQAGQAILEITPCLLMSPLSVATYLSKDSVKFDVVIFDEASQMPAEEALGAILRGEQLIVAGDPRQLPPTRFFERSLDEEDSLEDEAEESLESVLEDCSASSMQRCLLEWHYRSRHESLIAFSNAEFYENRLVTFPAPSGVAPAGVGLQFEYVEDGLYDRGGTRTNRAEARRIATLIEKHLDTWGTSRSLGVIALSTKQAEAVEDEVRLLAERRADLEPLLARSGEEPFFVKPLENVQGDERDTVFITIGYGRKTPGEVLSHNFGPINHEGGERRLNVAVTRAKWELVLVSSILASDIDESKVQSSGPKVLKKYLSYARDGRLPPETSPPTGEAESWFEERVWEALKEHGIEADQNVGVSRYRIDIAIKHPKHPGSYLLGIECDGAAYHSTKLARDRDRLRQEVLERLGWKIYRIWSTDWIRD
jgi:very-short-patch-repair endonuclease